MIIECIYIYILKMIVIEYYLKYIYNNNNFYIIIICDLYKIGI